MSIIEYPGIVRRYLSTTIDAVFVFLIVILIGYAFQQENDLSTKIKVTILLFMFFVYEPLCTSFFCTIGQKLTGIRVRDSSNTRKISLPRAYLRIITKLSLGFISFFTMPFSKQKRAIHDFAANSIVVNKEDA